MSSTLQNLVRRFRVLRGWTIRMDDNPDNHGTSWGGTMSNRYSIGTWGKGRGPQPKDYILHEVLHAALVSIVRMDKRRPKEQRQAMETLVQDLCRIIVPGVRPPLGAIAGSKGYKPLARAFRPLERGASPIVEGPRGSLR